MRRVIYPQYRTYITSFSSVVGKHEHEGPLGDFFDVFDTENRFGRETWEQSESEMQYCALNLALEKRGYGEEDVSLLLSGDLTNQCAASHFGAIDVSVPQINVYGACSTLAEEFILGAAFVGSGLTDNALCVTSSHFCTAERQFRSPVEYGGQRSPTSQWTVTGAGAFLLECEGNGPYIADVFPGITVDMGIGDSSNMGGAMAPAVIDTLSAYFRETSTSPENYDLIITGDLGKEGVRITDELLSGKGYDLFGRHADCGLLIYDAEKQDVHCGGSGCGCSASVMAAHFLPMMRSGELRDVLFLATGALLSTNSVQQKLTIPSVAHLVHLKTEEL